MLVHTHTCVCAHTHKHTHTQTHMHTQTHTHKAHKTHTNNKYSHSLVIAVAHLPQLLVQTFARRVVVGPEPQQAKRVLDVCVANHLSFCGGAIGVPAGETAFRI